MVYPVTSTTSDIVDGVNQALSGPSGLGQGFAGFNYYAPSYLTGNYRAPYAILTYLRYADGVSGASTITLTDISKLTVGMTVSGTGIGVGATVSSIVDNTITLTAANTATVESIVSFGPAIIPNLSVAPISLGVSQMLDERTWKFTFASAQPTPPFIPGQPIEVSGVTDPYYDGVFSPIGVTECTTTYVVARTNGSYPVVANSSGGTVELTSMDFLTSTDCLARATVYGNQQSVILSSQLNAELFTDPTYTGSYYYRVSINRYRAISNNDPTNPDFLFVIDDEPINGIPRPPSTLAYKEYLIDTTTVADTEVETIFTTIIDEPGIGYYQYILEVEFVDNTGGNIVTNMILTQRSFSAQVFKP